MIDSTMPGRGGLELTADLGRLYPAIAIVLTSGSPEVGLERRLGPHGFLQKPYSVAALREALSAQLSPDSADGERNAP